ncbi:hypothetical protein [Sutcliffiella horikoshii]|uniref:LysM domain-containing protein n=1 Tax=Sutcliffiella horikoshii TaxID=79883 RepID=A0A5D4TEV8_9BACI|nr:hypothetical protein [Sutcliffiella horikoshii]TYS74167.1 hypothetical protein FZC75_00190 [Sutcliffiella horikoshii]
MIRLFIAALILVTIYSIYYDLSSGTIPEPATPVIAPVSTTNPDTETESSAMSSPSNNLYIEVEIKAGDTVLTVAEKIANKPIPVSITQLIEDFQNLNEGITPEKIQIGKTYKFPVY